MMKMTMICAWVAVVLLGRSMLAQGEPRPVGTPRARLAIRTADGHVYNLTSDRARLGSTGERSHDILMVESRMSEVIDIVKVKHSLPWRDMTAQSPYAKTDVVLLWYTPDPTGAGNLMCSLGAAESARSILREVATCLPEPSRPAFERSLAGTTPAGRGAAQP